MSETFTFPRRDDNSSEEADKLVAWATTFDGVDAHIVWDSVPDSNGQVIRGALNGVTLQWGHVVEDEDPETPDVMVPSGAVHAPAGSTITRAGKGFEVTFSTNRQVTTPDGEPDLVVSYDVVRTADGDIFVDRGIAAAVQS